MRAWQAMATAVVVAVGLRGVWGQGIINPGQPAVGGVAVDAEGVVKVREVGKEDWAKLRARAAEAGKKQTMTYVSLPGVFAAARAAYEAKQPLPEDVRYLGGLTQVSYVFVYPDQKDLVIAGPAEAWDASNPVAPVGKASGRPVMQFEDLVVVMRAVGNGKGEFFGCSLDPSVQDPQKISDATVKANGSKPRGELAAALAKALGPQAVRIIGVPEESRVAVAMIAADYRLKRASLGLDTLPEKVGLAFDATSGTGRLWFEPKYEAVQVSEDGLSYGLRGPRLCVKAGAQVFKPGNAPAVTEKFAKALTEKMGDIAPVVPAWAELQNIADLGVVAALIKADKLEEKVGWDAAWAMRNETCPVAKVTAPKTADTLVGFTATGQTVGIASGGVSMSFGDVVGPNGRAAEKAGVGSRKRPETGWVVSEKGGAK